MLHSFQGKKVPEHPSEYLNTEAIAKLKEYLNKNFTRVYEEVRGSSKNSKPPIFLNSYDIPVARDAPAIRGFVGPWLYSAYLKNFVSPMHWQGLTEIIFLHVRDVVEEWSLNKEGTFVVPTYGILQGADSLSNGDSGDWVNEIHPNEKGWKKQVAAWLPLLSQV